jgi:NDP-sugar pyrophosphorylase family protein
LMPMTKNLPKPMLPVGGRPLLERIVVNLRDAGITRITLGTHYLPERIEEHFGDGSAFGVELRYVQEPRPLGTAGALGLMPAPEHRLVVINGDILTGLDFRAMADFHAENGADLTVAVRSYRFQVAYGVVEAEGAQVTGLVEKPSFEFFINAGIYVLEPGVAGQVPRNRHYDMTQLIARLLRKRATVIRFPVREYWLDVGQPADYQKANEDLAGGREPLDLE